jgi:hypothetical protein
MIKEHYKYYAVKNKTFFFFESFGVQGRIIKVVEIREFEENRWNLGFGDWNKGLIDDKIMTNNNDVVKVIGTVAKIAYDFFENYPNATIVIEPVDDKRKQLYNYVFQRHHKAIESTFIIKGLIGDTEELYSVENFYDGFEIKRKFEL